MGELVSIVYKPHGEAPREDGYTRVSAREARLIVGRGIDGDAKGASPSRQLNIMAASMVTELANEGFKAAPGELGEQLILANIEIDELPSGTRLHIGESACIEITEPRTGCGKFERYQGRLKAEVRGRLGQMARVVADGTVQVGDPVRITAMAAPPQ